MAVPRSCLGTDPGLYWTCESWIHFVHASWLHAISWLHIHTKIQPAMPRCLFLVAEGRIHGRVSMVYIRYVPANTRTSPAGLKHLYWGQSFTLVTTKQVPDFTRACYMLACRALVGRKEMLSKNWDSSFEEEPRTRAWGVREGRQKWFPSTRALTSGFYWQPHVAAVTQGSLNIWQVKSCGTVSSGTQETQKDQ